MTLPLFGTAALCRGLEEQTRSVVRLKALGTETPNAEADFIIVRTSDNLKRAIQNKHESIFAIDDGTGCLLPVNGLPLRTIAVSAQFSYFDAGDVIGIHNQSGKFRTLYRHNSRHNSFLMTERCNNYCLMCSQPPKNIDDRWILNEIRRSLPLLDKDTRTLTFTGGEPLFTAHMRSRSRTCGADRRPDPAPIDAAAMRKVVDQSASPSPTVHLTNSEDASLRKRADLPGRRR
ncbi:hypothetical protein SAMN05443247_11694 [Bradyrhizobium erythrophlei]|nr:hypothetical protein SAMN05443247_11694 [Bradyrhizobium erythrophlei]